MAPNDEEGGTEVVRLPVRTRRTEYGGGESMNACSVRCPTSNGDVALAGCRECERFATVVGHDDGPSSVCCRVPAAAVEKKIDVGELADRLRTTPVHSVMTHRVTCVDGELDLPEVDRVLREARVHTAPVVDDGGQLLGVISKTDLWPIEEDAWRNAHGLLVEDVMAMQLATLPEMATLADASRMFADRGVHRIPVLAASGAVVGILSLSDLNRWLARQL